MLILWYVYISDVVESGGSHHMPRPISYYAGHEGNYHSQVPAMEPTLWLFVPLPSVTMI